MFFQSLVTHGGGLLSQNVSSLTPTVWAEKGFEDLEEKDHSLDYLIN